jgi:hypothetical protein
MKNAAPAAASPDPRYVTRRGRNTDGEEDLQVVIHSLLSMIGVSLQRLLMCLPERDCTDRHRARSIVHSRIGLRYRSHEEV